MLALINNQPKVLNLHQMLEEYLKHQEEVVTRRTQYDLNKAEERAHILKGLLIALDNICLLYTSTDRHVPVQGYDGHSSPDHRTLPGRKGPYHHHTWR